MNVSLKQWADNGWIRSHQTSRQEIDGQFEAIELERRDAGKDLAPDTAFAIGYNSGLRLCTIALYAAGYRPGTSTRGHYYTIQSLPLILGDKAEGLASFLDACRKKRNIATYESVGMISPGEVTELLRATGQLEE